MKVIFQQPFYLFIYFECGGILTKYERKFLSPTEKAANFVTCCLFEVVFFAFIVGPVEVAQKEHVCQMGLVIKKHLAHWSVSSDISNPCQLRTSILACLFPWTKKSLIFFSLINSHNWFSTSFFFFLSKLIFVT